MTALYVFRGTQDAWAYSIDLNGENLPAPHAPWAFVKAVDSSDRSFRVGADKAALAEIEAKGFSVRIFTVTFEPVKHDPI